MFIASKSGHHINVTNPNNSHAHKEDFVRLFQPGVDPEAWGMSISQWLLCIDELLQ